MNDDGDCSPEEFLSKFDSKSDLYYILANDSKNVVLNRLIL